ncbi:MAG: DUF6049 family protein, partial [Actinomycetota bacterium]
AQVTALAVKSQASVGALVEDTGLTNLLNPSPGEDLSPAQMLGQFLADTATIEEEQPSSARTIAVITPDEWDPDPVELNGLLSALTPVTGAPWMTGITPDAATTAATLPGRSFVQNAPDGGLVSPPKDYLTDLRTARQRLDEFQSMQPSSTVDAMTQLVDQMTEQLLTAEGGEWWMKGTGFAGGEAFARAVSNRVNGQLGKIEVGSPTFTLTSKGAAIPLQIDSRLTYPVKVILYLASDKLDFQQGRPCPNIPASRATCLTQTILPRLQTIKVKASANSSGGFPVQVQVRTLNQVTIAQGRLLIRSTAYNVVALGIVGAAALFLLGTWAWGFIRRRVAAGRLSQVLPEAPHLPAGS